jgi:2-iminobutanoate/2-iminopropanoate deaminase
MKKISTPNAPAPAGHYSQAVVYGGVVYVAGMLGIDPENPAADPGDAAQQTRQALANVEAVLKAAGADLDCVVRMMVYVSGHDLWGEVNRVYAEVMGDHKPARAIVPVQSFREPFVVEIVATAALGGQTLP